MKYLELTCNFSNEEYSDILVAFLADLDYDSFYNPEPLVLKAYIKEELFNESYVIELQQNLSGNVDFRYSYKICKEENWNSVWEKNYDPVLVDNRCYVRASFHEKMPNVEFDIEIQPKMSFGTAHHETTYQILSEVLKMDVSNKSFLDMGCGTGVIAILAALKGANDIWAIENDLWAYENTLENVKRNKVDFIKVFHGDASLLKDKKFDIIIANINRNILLNDMEKYVHVLQKHGILILSGFYEQDIDKISCKANELGLSFNSSRTKNKWAVVNLLNTHPSK
ncbi:MAG: 50S ribosomal protein L11 methyltransferase [Bacteroidales bacterium]|jgi:ribosomal protein L11 methyltransferase